VFSKISLKILIGALTTAETVARLTKLESTIPLRNRLRASSLLTESEVQSLREEMIKDGARMKKWLAKQQCDQ